MDRATNVKVKDDAVPLRTKADLLDQLLCKNPRGVWLIKCDEGYYYPVPAWLVPFVKQIMKDK